MPLSLEHSTRRDHLRRMLALTGVTMAAGLPTLTLASPVMTRAERDALTPDQAIELLRQGNLRFQANQSMNRDYRAEKRATAGGQYPVAAILGCIDSRVPPEIVLDSSIGEIFSARVAANVLSDDILGSLEFSCAMAGAKVIVVMGHTDCGAVKGAITGVTLGHLAGLVNQIQPAIERTRYLGDRSVKNPAYVDAVIKANVAWTAEQIRQRSPILRELEAQGRIKIVQTMYHFAGGKMDWISA